MASGFFASRVGLLFAATGLGCLPVAAQEFRVVQRHLVSVERVMRTHVEYTYRVDIQNTGMAANEVRGTIVSGSRDTVVIDGDLQFGEVRAGQAAVSRDTFTVRHNEVVPFDPSVLAFQFQTDKNVRPIADAGEDQMIPPGGVVQLHGNRSTDADGSILKYEWTHVRSIPAGLAPSLSHSDSVSPTVLTSAAGTYVFHLVVWDNDGARSAPDEVIIRTGPVARAGSDRVVSVEDTVQLRGRESTDADGRPLTYSWRLLSPPGSNARLSDPHAPDPSLLIDVEGTYRAELTVHNGVVASEPDFVNVVGKISRGLIACGDLIMGTLTAPGERDDFTFSGQIGRRITLTLSRTGTGTWARATLVAPSGKVVGPPFNATSQQQFTLQETGTYTVQVTAYDSIGTGTYNLGLECRNPAAVVDAALGCGALQSGNLKASGQVDQYTFSGQSGRPITLTLSRTGAGTWARATLFAPSGVMVGLPFNATSQHQITLTETGTYVVQVSAYDLIGTGTYNIGLECRNPATVVDAALSCGALQSGTLTDSGQVDQYTFSGQVGRIVTLTLSRTGTGTWARATLFAPSGVMVGSPFNATSQHQIKLTEAGTYVVQVSAYDLTGLGTYNLGLECRNPPIVVDAALNCGALQSGTLTASGQVDQYTFSGQIGRPITLTLSRTGTGTWARATLFAPSGVMVGSPFNATSQHQITLTETGIYVVQVSAYDLTGTGTYNLGLECRNPVAVLNAALSCGTLQSGTLTASGQVDQYTFAGQVGRPITLTLSRTGAGTWARAILLAPSGVMEGSAFNATSQHQITLKEAGTYTVQVSAYDLTGTGTYNLGLECRNPAAVLNAALSCGTLQSGTLTASGQVDQYTFAGQIGRPITLTLSRTGTGTWARATLFAPSGVVEGAAFNATTQHQIKLKETGTYTVQVSAYDLTGTGTYNLGLECRNPVAVLNAALSCGTLQSGNLTASGQVDQYTFSGQAGRPITLTLSRTGTGTWARATLFAPSGVMEGVAFNATTQHQIMLKETGTYVVQVSAYDLTGAGTYNLGLECRNPAVVLNSSLGCGTGRPGTLSASGQVDQYAFSGQAGRAVTLTLSRTGTGTWARATLFAPSGVMEGSPFNATSQQQFVLKETGTYVVQVSAYDLTGIGTYNLDLTCQT